MSMSPNSVLKSYVNHGGVWFFISTMERASSAAAASDVLYWETIAWEYNDKTNERGGMLFQRGSYRGDSRPHIQAVEAFLLTGLAPVEYDL